MRREVKEKPTYAVVAAVQLPSVNDVEFEASLTELRELAKTLGFEVVHTFTQKRAGFDTTAYLGVGKRQEIRRFVNNETEHAELEETALAAANADTRDIDAIFVDHEISPSQARNLEKEVGCEVMDHTMVILEIFHRHARPGGNRAPRLHGAAPARGGEARGAARAAAQRRRRPRGRRVAHRDGSTQDP